MTPAEHDALVQRAAQAIRDATQAKVLTGAHSMRLTVTEAAEAIVTALYGPPEAYFRFDDETKDLVEFKPKGEKAA